MRPSVLLLIGLIAANALLVLPASAAYVVENRTLLVSNGISRSYVLARPDSGSAGLPLVFSLHGDGGNGTSMRNALPLEAAATTGAVFVYPTAPGNTFEYFSDLGRTREVQFVRELIDGLDIELDIDRSRVFITGFSGGATMANAVGCRMENDEIRAIAVHSGTLYPVAGDFTYTGNGGVSCAVPATMLVWGMSDGTGGVSYADGQNVRNNYLATLACNGTTTPRETSPCVDYGQCQRDVAWCAIPGLSHAIWNNAATAIWNFFADQGPTVPPEPAVSTIIYDDALQNGFADYSWGTVDFNAVANPHAGAKSIRFTAHSFQGLSFARPATPIAVASFPELRFWIRGDAGGEDFNISLQTDATLHANVPLAPYITGGAVVAGSWREVRVRFADPPMSYSGSFTRINIQDDTGNSAGNAQHVNIDDVQLLPAATGGVDFANGFEN